MVEYVLKQKIIDEIKYIDDEHELFRKIEFLDFLVNQLENIPPADVATVVHARWYWDDDGYCRCSRCHQKSPYYDHEEALEARTTYYCPHCGAKMEDIHG